MSENITVGGTRYAAKVQSMALMVEVADLEVVVSRASAALDRLDTEIAAKASRLQEMAAEGIVEEELGQIESDLTDLDVRRQEATRTHLEARLALVAAKLDGHDAETLGTTLDLRDLPEMERQLSARPT